MLFFLPMSHQLRPVWKMNRGGGGHESDMMMVAPSSGGDDGGCSNDGGSSSSSANVSSKSKPRGRQRATDIGLERSSEVLLYGYD